MVVTPADTLPDKLVTLITGTRKGIGRFLAEHYLAQGHVVYGCSREASDLEHPQYHHFTLNVADEAAVVAMLRTVAANEGVLHHVLNNAGIASMNHTLLTPLHVLDNIFSTNVKGTFLFCREAAKLMSRHRYGRIVNFATVATPLRLEGEAVYAASKAAVASLTQVLANELAPYHITVNAVGPTPIETDLIKNVPPAKMEALLARQGIQRFGTLADVANVTDFFLQPSSNFVTGQVLYLGGVAN
ncbi:MAG: SDR family NAD(P)-dependent oxidoreductase [Vampirovibrionales bacterium]